MIETWVPDHNRGRYASLLPPLYLRISFNVEPMVTFPLFFLFFLILLHPILFFFREQNLFLLPTCVFFHQKTMSQNTNSSRFNSNNLKFYDFPFFFLSSLISSMKFPGKPWKSYSLLSLKF